MDKIKNFDIVVNTCLADIESRSKKSDFDKNDFLLSVVNGFEDGKWREDLFRQFVMNNIAQTGLSADERENICTIDPYTQITRSIMNLRLVDCENGQGSEIADALTVYESIRPTKLYSRSYDPYTDSSVIEFGTNLKMAKKNQDTIAGNTINNCSVLAAFGNCNVGKTKLNDVYDYFAKQVKDVLAPGMLLLGYVKRHLDKDKDGNLKKFILNFLKDSDFNIEDVTLHEEEELITPELEQLIQKAPIADDAKSEMLKKGKITNTELTFTHRTGNSLYELSEEYESNGTMRFLGMGIILNFLLKNNQFVPIDEVETSIHYELLSYFIKVFLANSNQTSQMLLTTHDINLLNEEFIRRDTIWFTDKDEQGETNVVRLSALGLHKNLSPYNAYKQGKLVKLPFLGSQYFDLND